MTPKPWHKMLCPWLRGTSFCSSPPWGCCLQFYWPVASLGCCPGPIWILWINVAEMFVINYKCPFCMDDTNWKSFCVLDSDQISEKYEVPSVRNPCDTLGGIGQFCSSFRGWDCQPEETTVLRRFLAFFWHRFDPPDSYLWVWHGYFTKKSSLALFSRPQWVHEHFGTPLGRVATAYSIDKSK